MNIKIKDNMYVINDSFKVSLCNPLVQVVKKFYRESGELTPREWLEITDGDINYDLPDDSPLGRDYMETYDINDIDYMTDEYDLDTYHLDLSNSTWGDICYS